MNVPICTRLAAGTLALVSLALGSWQQVDASTPSSALAPPPNGMRPLEPGRGWFALMNATVHPRPGETIERAMVVVQDGKILAVVSRGEGEPALTAPAGAEARDFTGRHVYAGFIEPLVEVDVPMPDPRAPGSHWNSRVTPQRSALDKGAGGIDDKSGRTLRSLGFTAAGIVPRGGVIEGWAAVVSLAEAPVDPSQGPPEVYRDRAFIGVDFETSDRRRGAPVDPSRGDDLRWSRYPDSQMGAIALIRQTLNDAEWQAAARKAGSFKDETNCLDALAPLSGPEGKPAGPLLVFDSGDELEALRGAAIAREFDRSAAVLGSGMEFRRIEAIKAAAIPVIVPLTFPQKPNVATIGRAESVELREMINWEQGPTNPRRLDSAGVPVSLTSGKIPDKQGGRGAFADRLAQAIKHGLKPDRALAMLTTNPAELLGVADRLGTVAPGKQANLVVSDGPLFTDVPDAPKTWKKPRIVEVWIDGRRHVITDVPSAKLEGVWSVKLDPAPADGSSVTLSVTDRNEITVEEVTPAVPPASEPKKVSGKARNVRLDDNRLSFVLDHEKFGEPGVMLVSAVVEKDAGGVATIHGDAALPSGRRFTFTAARTGDLPPSTSDQAKKDEKPEDAKPEPKRETEAIAAIPESLGLPLGPYALGAYPAQMEAVITNATIWTSGPKGVIENGAVVISGGKIRYVGPAGDALRDPGIVKPDFITIDARGKYLAPGIIDCHSHTGISRGVNEAGQAVTAEVRIQDVTDPDSVSWYRQLAGGVTAVNSLHGSANPIGGQNCVNKIRWGCVAPSDMHMQEAIPGIKFALGENVKQSNWGNQFTTRYPQTRMGVKTIIRDRFTAAKEYAAAWDAWQKGNERTPDGFTDGRVYRRAGVSLAPRRDLELEALAEVVEGRRLVHCHSYRQDEILMLCRVAGDFGFKIGTFQHNLEGYKVAEAMREHALGASMFSDWWAFKVEVQDAIPFSGPIAHDQGVVVSYNSDSDELARRMNVEGGKAAKYSGGGGPATKLTPAQGYEFVTINAAKQLKIENVTGSIEVGKDADIALWSGPPSSSTSRCEMTWVDGRRLFSLEDDAAMRKQIASERARLIQKILSADAPGGGRSAKPKPDGDEDDKKPTPSEGDELDDAELAQARAAGRGLLAGALHDAQAVRRNHYLALLMRGLDPRYHRAGDCGCDASLFGLEQR
jgi:imidazolonepropionase-like amidohydrolase